VGQHLHLEMFHDEVVSSVLQQLFFQVLGRVKVLARRITSLTLALCYTPQHPHHHHVTCIGHL